MAKGVMEIESTTEVEGAGPLVSEEPSAARDTEKPEQPDKHAENEGPSPEEVERLLELQPKGRLRRWGKWVIAASLGLGLVAAIAYRWLGGATPAVQYRTSEVQRGPLTVFVAATGNLVPTDEVDVGSELSGIIASVLVDANDSVRAGQVLAKLDTSKQDALARQSRASLEAARARVQDAEASLVEARLTFQRTQDLHQAELVSQSSLDSAQAALQRAEASLATAKAQVSQAEANLSTIETDLTKAVIRSPVDGVVLARNVERGQTVAASFQAPVLFKIAQDLRRMELHVDVDEADVSRVMAGQEASFTVDAYPDRTFPAKIREVSYASKTVEGVVTYEAILDVENPELLLRPGMTATADIVVEKIDDALLVDNAALRFAPSTAIAASNRGGGLVSMLLPRRPRRERTTENKDRARQGPKVWTLRNGQLTPVPITTGSSDGTHTVVTSGALEPGEKVVLEVLPTGNRS